MRGRVAAIGAVFASLPLSAAFAADEIARPDQVFDRACRATGAQIENLSQQRIAEALVAENGLLPSDFGTTSASLPEMLRTIRLPSTTIEGTARQRLLASITLTEARIRERNIEAITVTGAVPDGIGYLFADSPRTFTLACVKSTVPASIDTSLVSTLKKRRVAVRKKPEEFALEGKSRKEAGSLALGVERVWTEADDGSEEKTTTLKVDGAIGVLLTDFASDFSLYGFAQYSLDKARKIPAPVLAPGKRRDEDDTNVLAIGTAIDAYAAGARSGSYWLTSQISYVLDFVDDSERFRISGQFEPGWNISLPFCNLGSARFFDEKATIGARCLIRLDSEVGLWTRDGIDPEETYEDFVAFGPRAGYEIFIANGDQQELLGSIAYRYLPVLAGERDDFERFDASLKQRFWTVIGLGFDIGVNYVSGDNSLSLEDEKKLTFNFGLIY